MGRPEVVCYHEAGHAVAYMSRAIPIDTVCFERHRCIPAEIESAVCPIEWEGRLDLNEQVEDTRLRMLAKLVGPAADEKRFGPGDRLGDNKDLDEARAIARESHPPETVDAFVDQMLGEARRFVDTPENWECIERIAQRMMARYPQSVSGKELYEWFKGDR
jgi:hypothetical protein